MTEPSRFGFLRAAVASPELRVADVSYNAGKIEELIEQAAAGGCGLVVFPELCLTGYTCADLFYQGALLSEALAGVTKIASTAMQARILAIVGLPFAVDGRLFNCAALLSGGRVAGLVPKSYLPTTNEYYEERWFSSGRVSRADTVPFGGYSVPFGTDLLFSVKENPAYTMGIEICEDLWAVEPPSGRYAVAGAILIANPSASTELLSKAEYRRELVKQQSARCLAAYLYAGAGPNESTTDVVFGGHSLIFENGVLLAETERFSFGSQHESADIDIERLRNERIRSSSFSDAPSSMFRHVEISGFEPAKEPISHFALKRPVPKTPFVPSDERNRDVNCREIFSIQSIGLAKRLLHTMAQNVVLGISGGLDSTLALLVTCKAFDLLKLPVSGVLAVTMPGFGTTGRTRGNAERLIAGLGTKYLCIPIGNAVNGHFKDIGHDPEQHDTTYENAQARERTQILMDLANKIDGLVVGTGDLSELALGWSTFNGDHMSMYNVNGGVPKTLVRYLVEWVAEHEYSGEVSAVLNDICATPITPELLPPSKDGKISQETENLIGPYELHDFFLYYAIRCGFGPAKIAFLAGVAYADAYSEEEIRKWLTIFYRRFFRSQFKRSTLPDGPKVGSVALSPRGDWRMPSDASEALWTSALVESWADKPSDA